MTIPTYTDRSPENHADSRGAADTLRAAQASESSESWGLRLSQPAGTELTIRPRRVVALVGFAIVFLQLLSFAGQYAKLALGHDYIYGLVPMFDVNMEANVPTWFQSVLLLCCAASLGITAALARRAGEPFVRHWLILAFGFLLMSLDEAAQVHDTVNILVFVNGIRLPPILMFPWVIAGALIAAAAGVAYVPLLRHLPRRTRLLAGAAGLIYVIGSVGLEALGGIVFDRIGWETIESKLVVAAEETAEMIGAALLLYAVLDYQARRLPPFTVRLQV